MKTARMSELIHNVLVILTIIPALFLFQACKRLPCANAPPDARHFMTEEERSTIPFKLIDTLIYATEFDTVQYYCYKGEYGFTQTYRNREPDCTTYDYHESVLYQYESNPYKAPSLIYYNYVPGIHHQYEFGPRKVLIKLEGISFELAPSTKDEDLDYTESITINGQFYRAQKVYCTDDSLNYILYNYKEGILKMKTDNKDWYKQ
ncbi:MAG: hypothetical protein WC760_06675 [Bacteroidia bacterium]|jgi:hypothetical protein